MSKAADVIITNARVYSILFDDTEIRAEAIAISNGKISAIGDNAEVESFADYDTEIINAKDNSVLPGFCDAHLHASFSGSTLFACNLFGLKVREGKGSVVEKCQRILKEYIESNKDKEMIKGCGWDMGDFLITMPNKTMLDKVCPDKPVFLESYCQHHMWLNSKALEMAGITKDTNIPRNGLIYKDKNGEPTGLLSEFSAINIVKDNIPEYDYTTEEYKEILKRYQRDYANAYGVTLIFDALSTENAKEAFRQLAQNNELTIRIRDNEYADPTRGLDQFEDFIDRKGKSDVDDLYVKKTIKFFMESQTPDMCFTEPYRSFAMKIMQRPKGYKGFVYWEEDELNEILPLLLDAGFQIHTHAMGDGSVRHTVNAYEYAQKKIGKNTRNVIAHLMYVQPVDIKRMGELDIIACVQPTWMGMDKNDIALSNFAFGKKRVEQFYPYKRFLDAGAIVSAGTDFPVTPPPDPFIEMEYAITRTKVKKLAPKKNSDQDVVSLKDIVKSRTISGAYQCFAEDITGSIEVGKSADIIVLDRDLEKTKPEDIHKTKVDYTLFKGDVVYNRKDDQNECAK